MRSRGRRRLSRRLVRAFLATVPLAGLVVLAGSGAAAADVLHGTLVAAPPTPATPTCAGGPLDYPGSIGGHCLLGYGVFPSSDPSQEPPDTASIRLALLILWTCYRFLVGIAIWLLHSATTLSWLGEMRRAAEPAQTVAHDLVHLSGAVPLLLVWACLLGGVWLLRGRWVGGLAEVALSMTAATLALLGPGDPVDAVAGDSGLLVRSRDLAAAASAPLSAGAGVATPYPETSLVDAMVRVPHMLVTLGGAVPKACLPDYERAVEFGRLSPALEECLASHGMNQALGVSSRAAIVALLGLGMVIVLAAMVFAFGIVINTVVALVRAITVSLQLMLAIAPGYGRMSLYRAMGLLAGAVLALGGSMFFVSGYTAAMNSLFASKDASVSTFVLASLTTVAAMVFFVRWRRALRYFAERAAEVAARWGPSSKKRIPETTWDMHGASRMESYRERDEATGNLEARLDMEFGGAAMMMLRFGLRL